MSTLKPDNQPFTAEELVLIDEIEVLNHLIAELFLAIDNLIPFPTDKGLELVYQAIIKGRYLSENGNLSTMNTPQP